MYQPIPVFWSCDAVLPEAAMAGQAWDGPDLLLDGPGVAAAGRLPGLWADGTHVSCRRDGGGHLIAADPRGAARLFLYQRGRTWAVSTSFVALVEAVAARRWPMHLRRYGLMSWRLGPSDFDQVPFPETAVAEIRLIATWEVLRIIRGRVTVTPRPAFGPAPALEEVLALWLGRMLTLLHAPQVRPVLELTGGLDSRTCLALALHLRASGQVSDLDGLPIVSGMGQADDLEVAQHLAADYGLRLNPSLSADAQAVPAGLRFRQWRGFSLGILALPYVLPARMDPARITIGGQGGEYLRLLSFAKEFALLNHIGGQIPGPVTRWHWRRALARAWAGAQGRLLPGAPPALQYRWAWRVRQLQGHLGQTVLRTTPLAGVGFWQWLRTRPPEWLQDGRVLFAVQQRLAPGLAAHRFVDPGYRLPDDLPAGGAPIVAQAGQVWGMDAVLADPTCAAGGDLLPLFRTALSDSASAGSVRLIGAATQAAAEVALAGARNDRLPPHAAFKPVHLALLAGLLARTCRGL